MKRFIVLDKQVGETPLECMEAWRATQSPALRDVPLTYAGRLDPMASGKLLILIDEECKKKEEYLGLDKEYEFEILLGVKSDTGDVLGLVTESDPYDSDFNMKNTEDVCKMLIGEVELPYPHYSSKTVQGKPLHTWALEGRLDEIEIPTKQSVVHKLELMEHYDISKEDLYSRVTKKIETIAPVTDKKKALGNDFRRPEVRKSWQEFSESNLSNTYTIAKFRCTASSGTYMRTLAEVIAGKLGTTGLAYSIHRTKIGRYRKLPLNLGIWIKRY